MGGIHRHFETTLCVCVCVCLWSGIRNIKLVSNSLFAESGLEKSLVFFISIQVNIVVLLI